MSAIFVLIIVSLIVAIGFLLAFLWAVKDNQYEDDYTPSVRMLFDDAKPETASEPAITNVEETTSNN
jgi:cbb3-type cytochrome oxidase maturation protein